MDKNGKEGTEEERPITRGKLIKLGQEHAADRQQTIRIGNHEATKMTLKRLGNMRDDLERIFQEQSRHCRHREIRFGAGGFWCGHELHRGDVVALSCNYRDCPYVNREVL